MPNSSERSTSKKKDSVTSAPESGEPKESGRTRGRNPKSTTGSSEKSKPSNPKIGEDFESGRQDATP